MVWFWFYYALWLASVFTLVLVLRQSSENRSIDVQILRPPGTHSCYLPSDSRKGRPLSRGLTVHGSITLYQDNILLAVTSALTPGGFG